MPPSAQIRLVILKMFKGHFKQLPNNRTNLKCVILPVAFCAGSFELYRHSASLSDRDRDLENIIKTVFQDYKFVVLLRVTGQVIRQDRKRRASVIRDVIDALIISDKHFLDQFIVLCVFKGLAGFLR